MLEEAEHQWEAAVRSPAQERPLPLLRLRVAYDTQIPLGNLARFGQTFAGRVANPKDLVQLQWMRGRRTAPSTRASVVPFDSRMAPAEKLERIDLATLVMENVRLQPFDLLSPQGLQASLLGFVEKDERESITTFLDKTIARVEQQLSSQHMQEAQLQTSLDQIRLQQSDSTLPVASSALLSSQESMDEATSHADVPPAAPRSATAPGRDESARLESRPASCSTAPPVQRPEARRTRRYREGGF